MNMFMRTESVGFTFFSLVKLYSLNQNNSYYILFAAVQQCVSQ